MEKAVCFTGHRPEKLPDGGSGDSVLISTVKSILTNEINDAVISGYSRFLTGMARGVDLWAGEIVADMISGGMPLSLTAVFPHAGYENRYRSEDMETAEKILANAAETVYLSGRYYKGCMAARNKYLVDHASRVIAVVSDFCSGTGQTIGYARKAGLELRIINLKELIPDDPNQLKLF